MSLNLSQWVLLVFAGLHLVMGLVTFVVYGQDKKQARLGRRRVPEQTLHTLELAFGWLGAFVGQRVYRHKTSKASYQKVFWLIGMVHLVLLVGVLWWVTGQQN